MPQKYNVIVNNGCASKFSNYFIHHGSKNLMLYKEDIMNNTFSLLIIVPHSFRSKIFTIMQFSHFGLTKTYELDILTMLSM